MPEKTIVYFGLRKKDGITSAEVSVASEDYLEELRDPVRMEQRIGLGEERVLRYNYNPYRLNSELWLIKFGPLVFMSPFFNGAIFRDSYSFYMPKKDTQRMLEYLRSHPSFVSEEQLTVPVEADRPSIRKKQDEIWARLISEDPQLKGIL